ncbi:uncharacterized protein LOC135221494 isoform X2 [Macrobrachium nipponense]|uniref:uncharacterized protein LOC135221494 isoform X2 n=1 Tax=Macrobrachium nipponense TaxID=159736 RepID=UPI0030C7E5F9
MSDDATQPQSSFYSVVSSSFAKFTHFIDKNIRVIQYGVYCTGVVGLVICLRSVRAFSKFNCIQDIPQEFITKHIRLHGHVKWVGVSPPVGAEASSCSAPPLLPLPGNVTAGRGIRDSNTPSSQSNHLTSSVVEELPNADNRNGNENVHHERAKSLREDDYALETATLPRPRLCSIDPEVTRIECDEDLFPVYLQVDHIPVFQFSRKKEPSLLPLQLADVEVSDGGFHQLKRELMEQRVWFTIVSHDQQSDLLNAWVRPAKVTWNFRHHCWVMEVAWGSCSCFIEVSMDVF